MMRNGGGGSMVEAYWTACPYASIMAMFHEGVPRLALPIFFDSASEPCLASRMKQPCL